ncbi:MAG: response regulator transcription factor [Acidobacteria bacterium]|nr:response regulator transcription factor [Acidobacteriota bacterium]
MTDGDQKPEMRPVPRPIRVGIVEDRDEIREGLADLIAGADGFACSGAWGTMEEALAAIAAAPPTVVLVDLGLPGMSGVEGIRRLRVSQPALPTVVLSVYRDDERIFAALCAGACGYLLKKTPAPRLLSSLEEAVTGGAPMSPEIARQVVNLFTRFQPPERAESNLTPHETRVLKLLVDGHTLQAAAELLGVGRPTIAFHVRHIYEKLQVHSRSEAVAKALRAGLVR